MDPLHIQKNFKDHPNIFLLAFPLVVFILLVAIFLRFHSSDKVLGVSTSNLDSSEVGEENR